MEKRRSPKTSLGAPPHLSEREDWKEGKKVREPQEYSRSQARKVHQGKGVLPNTVGV